MKNIVHFDHTEFGMGGILDDPTQIARIEGGVDSSNDGVAIGLGIFPGFSHILVPKPVWQYKLIRSKIYDTNSQQIWLIKNVQSPL